MTKEVEAASIDIKNMTDLFDKGLHIRHYYDADNERVVTIVYCKEAIVGLLAGNTKYITKLSDMSLEFLSHSKNEYIKDLLENGIKVAPAAMDVYVEHYLQDVRSVKEQ